MQIRSSCAIHLRILRPSGRKPNHLANSCHRVVVALLNRCMRRSPVWLTVPVQINISLQQRQDHAGKEAESVTSSPFSAALPCTMTTSTEDTRTRDDKLAYSHAWLPALSFVGPVPQAGTTAARHHHQAAHSDLLHYNLSCQGGRAPFACPERR